MPSLRVVAGSALLALVVSGCGSQSAASDSSTTSSDGPSSAGPSTAKPSSAPNTTSEKAVQALRDRVQKTGVGTFSMVTRTVPGKLEARIDGHYDLKTQQLSSGVRIPQHGGRSATARVDMIKDAAYFQVAQWDKPARTCWLRTSPEELSQKYGIDIASSDEVPIPIQLLDDFQAASVNGKGLIDGKVDIASVLPLLSSSNKAQIVAAKPTGTVPAFLTFSRDQMNITVPGYALSTALSGSLGVDPSKFSTIAEARYTAGVRIKQSVPGVQAPGKGKQMSQADLKANRCG